MFKRIALMLTAALLVVSFAGAAYAADTAPAAGDSAAAKPAKKHMKKHAKKHAKKAKAAADTTAAK